MSFDAALEFVLGYEGGYSNNPKDPGGETNLGITQRTLTEYVRTHSSSGLPTEAAECEGSGGQVSDQVSDEFTQEQASEAVRMFCIEMRDRGWCVFAMFADHGMTDHWRLAGPDVDRGILAGALRDVAFQCEDKAPAGAALN